MSSKTLAIIGSGIAGPTLALQILSHPILRTLFTPILYDSSPNPTTTTSKAGATVGLFSNGLYPLQKLGLGDDICSLGFECRALSTWRAEYDGKTEKLNALENAMWSPDLKSGVVYFERQALQNLLVKKFQELGGQVNWDKKAVKFETLQDERLNISFTDKTSISADILVGADGGYSAVRKFILQQRNEATAESRWLPDHMGLTGIYGISSAVKAADASSQFADSHLMFLDKGFLATGPCPDGKIRWDLVLPEDEPPSSTLPLSTPLTSQKESWQSSISEGQYPLNSTTDLLKKHESIHHPYVGTLFSLFKTSDRIVHSSLRQRYWTVPEIQHKNAVLIGDAARLMLPTSGQGTGFAIEDATVLARTLLNHKTSERTTFEEYARLRVPRSRDMTSAATLASMWATSPSWFWKGIRYYGSKWQPKGAGAMKNGKEPWPFNERLDVE